MERATYYTSKDDLRDYIPGEQYYAPGDPSTQQLTLKITGGTTGVPAVSILGTQGWRYDVMSRFIRITPKNTSTLASIYTVLRESPHPLSVLPMNMSEYDRLSPEEFRTIVTEFSPREFHTTRSVFLHLIDDLEKKELLPALKTVRSVHMTGETLEASHLKRIREAFPQSRISADYGTSEGGNIADSCSSESQTEKEPSERRYHPVADKQVEIIDPDESGFGEIVATSREIYRYKTGDLGKLVDETCSCGARQTLYIGGRADYDVARCAGAIFFASDIDRVFSQFHASLSDYVLDVGEQMDGGVVKGRVTCSIVLKQGTAASAQEVEKRVKDVVLRELYVTPTRTLGDLLKESIFSSIDVRTVEAIERNSPKRYHLRKK